MTWDFFVEALNIGGKAVFTTSDNFKSSAGTGLGYKLVLFNIFPVHLELSVAKAFENRPPLFYCTLSTIYYTWRN